MLHRAQIFAHDNRPRWALSASRQLSDEADTLLRTTLAGRDMLAAADDDPTLYDGDLLEAMRLADERTESLITQAVVNGAAAIEGAFHGLAVAALGTQYADVLNRVSGMPWRWRLLVRMVWSVDLKLDDEPLRSVGQLFTSRNWLMHPTVVDLHEEMGDPDYIDDHGAGHHTLEQWEACLGKVENRWASARQAALSIESTFAGLADCIDALDSSAGIGFELLGRGNPPDSAS